jgi:DNA-binding IclR family transcriptional regulator
MVTQSGKNEGGEGTATTLQGVASALRALRLMSDHKSVGVREAARLLGVTPTVAQRLLRTLVAEGFLEQSQSERTFSLTPLILEIADGFLSSQSFAALANRALEELHKFSSETVALYGMHDGMRSVLAEVQSRQPLRMVARVGTVSVISNSAIDQVFRAYASSDEVARIDERLAADHSGLPKSRPAAEELREVRELGWAASFGVRTPGSAAVAAPVQSDRLYVVSVFGPADRMNTLGIERTAERTLQVAADLVRSLSWLESRSH